MSLNRATILFVLASAVGIAGYFHFGQSDDTVGSGPPIVAISVPEALSARALAGQKTWDANCASCHGRHAVGQDGIAPPLVHIIYEPGHHGDESFQRAVALGVRAHHWPFGDMPPVEGLSRRDVAEIIVYVRELQRANGIR
ncbi:MAG: cytochrome c [bacterium]|nr:cytochrome c [bacterium]MDE0241823.1 cytochrome c [bacterium]MDE0417284.1 cytochrome c [bacterium]